MYFKEPIYKGEIKLVLCWIPKNGQPFYQGDQNFDLKTWRDKKSSKKAFAGYNIHLKAF